MQIQNKMQFKIEEQEQCQHGGVQSYYYMLDLQNQQSGVANSNILPLQSWRQKKWTGAAEQL